MTRPEKIRLGDLLIQQKLISEEQLVFALEQQKHIGLRLGRILVNNAFVTEEHISQALARQFNFPYLNLKNFPLKSELVMLLPESLARQFHAIVLEDRNGMLLVGMADPTDLTVVDEIALIVRSGIDVAVVTEGQLLECIDRSYSRVEGITGSK